MSQTREQHAEMRRKSLEEEARAEEVLASLDRLSLSRHVDRDVFIEAAAIIRRLQKFNIACTTYLLDAEMKPVLGGDRVWHPDYENYGIVGSLKFDNAVFCNKDGEWTVLVPVSQCYKDRASIPKRTETMGDENDDRKFTSSRGDNAGKPSAPGEMVKIESTPESKGPPPPTSPKK